MLVCSGARLMVERRRLANDLHALLLELEGGCWNLARVEAREVELGLLRHNLISHLDILFLILVQQIIVIFLLIVFLLQDASFSLHGLRRFVAREAKGTELLADYAHDLIKHHR